MKKTLTRDNKLLMTKQAITEVVRETVAAVHKIDSSAFETENFHVDPRHYLIEKKRLHLTSAFGLSIITIGLDKADRLKENLKDHADNKSLDEADIQRIFPTARNVDTHPNFIYEKEEFPAFTLPEGYSLKEVFHSDLAPLKQFVNSSDPDDIEDVEIDIEELDHQILLVYFQNKPIGYAGYRIWEGKFGEVGILIQQDHRQKGLGVAAVAEVTRMCLESGFIPYYQTNWKNEGSAAIAKKLGYTLRWESKVFEW